MPMLPPKRPQASRADVEAILARHAALLYEATGGQPCPVRAVAVRGYYLDSMGAAGKNDRGIYDDALFILGEREFVSYTANTDPSIYKAGRAVLEAPQVVIYRPGYHGYNSRFGHPAFRQASDVIVRRDGGQGNGKPLGGGRFTDAGGERFWINLHRGGRSTTSSAGCQTVPPAQWDAFHATVTMLLKRHGVGSFPYLLVEDPRIA